MWRFVAKQLEQYLTVNGLLPRHQSAYHRHHSTQTAMLRVLSDVFEAVDSQQVTLLLGLLDLSAAFDCVDHQLLLLMRLQWNFGLTETVLQWITSFVTGQTRQMASDIALAATVVGVPQGSVLGSLLFILYTRL